MSVIQTCLLEAQIGIKLNGDEGGAALLLHYVAGVGLADAAPTLIMAASPSWVVAKAVGAPTAVEIPFGCCSGCHSWGPSLDPALLSVL